MSAIISSCGAYRYRLERECSTGMGNGVFAYFGINPSTADASIDDATVRKWRGFTAINGGHRFVVGNVFAYRATDVRDLANLSPAEAVGADNHKHILAIIADADVLVPCWGNSSKVPRTHRPAVAAMLEILRESGKQIRHFGLTASGDPKHPLMLAYSTRLTALADVAIGGNP